MVTIHYPPTTKQIENWTVRLDATFTKYEVIKVTESTEPTLRDGEVSIVGESAIETYITGCEQFFSAWYDDRCDKHD